jgi:uncharacterized protein (PEP-CTERM system associated)
VLDNGYQRTATTNAEYALSRFVAILGELGYEDISFPAGTPPVRITDAVWAFGVKLTPNALSSVRVTYGHRYGFDSVSLGAAYRLTQRTTLYADYGTQIGSDAQQLQSNLAASDIDQTGSTVDALTGAPLAIANQFFGQPTSLYRYKTLSFSARTVLDRDTINVSVLAQEQTLLSTLPGSTAFSQNGIVGSILWSRELRHDLSSAVYLDYGYRRIFDVSGAGNSTPGNQRILDISLKLSYAITQTLDGIAQYVFTNRRSDSSIAGNSYYQNIFLVGLTKTF